MDDLNCQGDHTEHFCMYANNKQFEKIANASKDPKFICFNCGRIADFKEKLCNPVLLKSMLQ